MQNAHKFLKIKFGTSKAFHGWLWQVQAFPSDSWENVLIWLSCCPISVGKFEKHETRDICHPSPLAEITHLAKWW